MQSTGRGFIKDQFGLVDTVDQKRGLMRNGFGPEILKSPKSA